jgi:hypothetical protein
LKSERSALINTDDTEKNTDHLVLCVTPLPQFLCVSKILS